MIFHNPSFIVAPFFGLLRYSN